MDELAKFNRFVKFHGLARISEAKNQRTTKEPGHPLFVTQVEGFCGDCGDFLAAMDAAFPYP